MLIRSTRPGSCEIHCDVSKNFALLSALPGRKKWMDRVLVFSPTGANIEFINTNWPDADWEESAQQYLDDWLLMKIREQQNREDKHDQLQDASGYQFKTVPFDHQIHSFVLARDQIAWGHLHEQGCGKTKVAIDTFAYLWENDKVDVMIVVAPNGVHANWILTELPIHIPDRIKADTFIYSAGMKKSEHDRIAKLAQGGSRRACAVVAFNVEGFVSQKAKTLLESIMAKHRCIMIVDESNSIQNASADRTKYIIKQGAKAAYRRILCGTPITRGVENLYGQFTFLDPLILGHTSFYTFRAQYCIMGGFEQRQIVGYRHIQELADIVDGHSDRVLKKDCLDLPEKIYKGHFFEMTDSQRIAYETVRKSALQDLEEVFGTEHGQALAQEIAITRLIRLQQISCGWIPYPADQDPIQLAGGNPRIDALIALLRDVEGKAIIWVNAPNSRADIRLIADQLRKHRIGNFVEYHGSIKDGDRELAKKLFQEEDERRVKFFLASKAAARGLTLTAADQAFYYTNNFDLMIRQQSEDRNHRIGSQIHKSILYTDIYTTGIDKKIVKSLREKKSIADQITKDPASFFMEGI